MELVCEAGVAGVGLPKGKTSRATLHHRRCDWNEVKETKQSLIAQAE